MTRSGRSKHKRDVHGINNSSGPGPGPSAPAPRPGQVRSSTGHGTQGPVNSPCSPGSLLPESGLCTFQIREGLLTGSLGLSHDSGLVVGQPRFESTRIDQSESESDQPESDESETLESESEGFSDDSKDLTFVI